jgi:hypothetical protein
MSKVTVQTKDRITIRMAVVILPTIDQINMIILKITRTQITINKIKEILTAVLEVLIIKNHLIKSTTISGSTKQMRTNMAQVKTFLTSASKINQEPIEMHSRR